MSQKVVNPFYVLLMVVGLVFSITACAYGVMVVKLARPDEQAIETPPDSGMVAWMDEYGTTLLLAELAALAVTTTAAIGTDDYWTQRAARRQSPPPTPAPPESPSATPPTQG